VSEQDDRERGGRADAEWYVLCGSYFWLGERRNCQARRWANVRSVHDREKAPGKGDMTTAKPKTRHKIFIIEDHPITRDGFAELINYQHDLVACGHAGTAAKAMAGIEASEPNLIIVDVSLPDAHGIELIKDLVARRPAQRILVLSMHDETLYAERALRAGAKGYVMKQEPTEVVLSAIRTVLLGGTYLSPRMQERALERFGNDKTDASRSSVETLTDRELEVFELIGRGFGTREIGSQLKLSVSTVETYRAHLKEKLQLASGTELTHRAIEWLNRQKA
jgi:DNA-binding NarL/FixJ family response regulator